MTTKTARITDLRPRSQAPASRTPSEAAGARRPGLLAATAHRARNASKRAYPRLLELTKKLGASETDLKKLLEHVRVHTRATINFNAGKVLPGGKTLAQALTADPHYRSVFETQVTQDSWFDMDRRVSSDDHALDYYQRARRLWERQMFGDKARFPKDQHPIWAGLNLMQRPEGAAPGYGPDWFELKPEVLSHAAVRNADGKNPRVGTAEHFAAALLAHAEAPFGLEHLNQYLLHVTGHGDRALDERFRRESAASSKKLGFTVGDDTGFDVLIFGRALLLKDDVTRIVGDVKKRGTPAGDQLQALARQIGRPLAWHDGKTLVD